MDEVGNVHTVLLHVLEALDISTLALRQVRRINAFSRISWGSCPRPQKTADKVQTLSFLKRILHCPLDPIQPQNIRIDLQILRNVSLSILSSPSVLQDD